MSPNPVAIHPQTTIAELAATSPATIRVFQRHGIDFCCGGKRPLAAVCSEHALDVDAITAELEAANGEPRTEPDWRGARLGALVAHLVARYHEPLREELPALLAMADKVSRVHGEAHPETRQILAVLSGFASDLERHMAQEEDVAFRPIVDLERHPEKRPPAEAFAALAALQLEHERAGAALVELRRLSADFTPPPGACNTYRGLYWGLAALEATMHEHVHLENNVLFPRALALAGAA